MTLPRPIRRFLRDEGGITAYEFALVFPVVFSFFLLAFELCFMMVRVSVFERALDQVVRDLRLGLIRNPEVEFLEQRLCSRTSLFPDCMDSLEIELTQVNQTTFALPDATLECVRTPEIQIDAGQPAPTFNTGEENDMMVIRACMVIDTVTPIDGGFDYRLIAASAFVNEPN